MTPMPYREQTPERMDARISDLETKVEELLNVVTKPPKAAPQPSKPMIFRQWHLALGAGLAPIAVGAFPAWFASVYGTSSPWFVWLIVFDITVWLGSYGVLIGVTSNSKRWNAPVNKE